MIETVVQGAYNRLLRDRLPRKWGVFGDVPARDVEVIDH